MIFLDTNIFLRYLVSEDAAKTAACLALLERVEAGEEAVTSEVVLSEVVYVLSSPRQYKLARSEISARLLPVILLRGLRVPEKRRLLRALDLYRGNTFLDFEDCLTIAQVEQQEIDTLVSYDRDFDRVPSVVRVEPPL